MDKVNKLGVRINLGSKVDNIDFTAGKLYLDGGKVATGDVIIGADGECSCLSTFLLHSLISVSLLARVMVCDKVEDARTSI